MRTANAAHAASWGGRTCWYFCCAGCKQKFLADPMHNAPAEQAAP